MIKLLNANYDTSDGVSSVLIQTDLGNFYGYSFLHPDDKDIESSFLGCEIAEYRATIQYFEKKLYNLNIEIKTLENLQRKIGYDISTVNKVILEKKEYKKEIKMYIKNLYELINFKIDYREKMLEKINKKHSNE